MISCSDPMAPTDEELFAYVVDDETLDEESLHHLEHCPICQLRLKDYQRTHERLLSRLYRTLCPDPTQLMLYCEQVLSDDEETAIADHVYECLLCRDEVRDIRSTIANFTPFPEAPMSPLEHVAQELKRLIAQPVIQLAPARRSSVSWPRYYQADDIHLSLQLSRASYDQTMLLGIFIYDSEEQIKAFEGSLVELYQLEHVSTSTEMTPSDIPAEKPFLSTSVDHMGHFSFSPLPTRTYTIRVHLPDTELLIEQVKLE